MVEVEFKYKNQKIIMRCNENEKMKDICFKFAIKADIDLEDLNFFYLNNQLNEELSFMQCASNEDKQKKKMKIIVEDENFISNNMSLNINNHNKIEDINEINMIYKYNSKSIKVFGSHFVKRNNNHCQIIYEGKKYKLEEYFKIKNKNKNNINNNKNKIKTVKITLYGIKNITNMSHLFSGCKSLLSLPDISKWDTTKITSYI